MVVATVVSMLIRVGRFNLVMYCNIFCSTTVAPLFPKRKPHQRFVMLMKEAPLNPHNFFYGKQSIQRFNFSYESFNGNGFMPLKLNM